MAKLIERYVSHIIGCTFVTEFDTPGVANIFIESHPTVSPRPWSLEARTTARLIYQTTL
jgi:hypothetical protein